MIGIAASLTALWFISDALTSPTKLEVAVEKCYLGLMPWASLDQDGKGLFLDGQGKEELGLTVDHTFCILRELELPISVKSRIQNTTSIMGQQEAEWDGITALWTFHPDNGLDISLEMK
jgi:hypothetical protein